LKNTAGGTWTGVFANHDADWSTPNDTYFKWVKYVFQRMFVYGFLGITDLEYFGFNLGVDDGWLTTITNSKNTQAVMNAFGVYLAGMFGQCKNIVFDFGTDTFPTPGSEAAARVLKLYQGWVTGGGSPAASGHYQRSSGSTDHADFASNITIRACYPGTGGGSPFSTNVARLRHEYAASPVMPVFSVESNYSPGRTDTELRTMTYHAWLSGIGGYAGYGQEDVWTFNTDGVPPPWKTGLTVSSASDLSRLWTYMNSQPKINELVPRDLGSIGALVTAGGGTIQTMGNANPSNNSNVAQDNTDGNDWVAAAATPDGSLLLGYVSDYHSGSVRIDMSKLRGTVIAKWWDPTDGNYTSIGSLPNTGTHDFTVPGPNSSGKGDWLLELTSP
jgi:hypothetical protein